MCQANAVGSTSTEGQGSFFSIFCFARLQPCMLNVFKLADSEFTYIIGDAACTCISKFCRQRNATTVWAVWWATAQEKIVKTFALQQLKCAERQNRYPRHV